MKTPFEQHVVDALEKRATEAMEPDPAFFAAVRQRTRQRRRRHRAAFTGVACALAFAIGTATLGVPAICDNSRAVEPWANPTKVPDVTNLPGPETVWPKAVRTLPPTLPDGTLYRIFALLPGNRYLVQRLGAANPDDVRTLGPNVFDPATGTATPLAAADAARDTLSYLPFSGAGVIGEYAVWWVAATGRDGVDIDIWSKRLGGADPARKLFTIGAIKVVGSYAVAVVGNYVMWQLNAADPTDIYRLPPTGGEPEVVPGAIGYRLNGSPHDWTTKVLVARDDVSPPAQGGELLNLTTGERLTWTLNSRAKLMTCAPLSCAGTGQSGRMAVQQRDGSGYAEIDRRGAAFPMAGGRFVVGRSFQVKRDQVELVSWGLVWDRKTGRAAQLSEAPESDPDDEHFVTWKRDGKVLVLDLQKIK